MSWPTPQDYNEALQNPRLNFEDPDLKSGTPEMTPLGLPRPITGGFASVYRVRSNNRQWAVRCFLRDFSDNQERYAAIGRHLAAAGLPYTVGFQFLEKGIRVRGKWHPVLKMEWIEGSTFRDAIEANVHNPLAVSNLAERWMSMLRQLKRHSIAHGDLQHGNVLICGGDFRLIDYDGMFVPSLAGRISHEVGHRNYQHPARDEKDFGPYVDNFSGWAIYLSLIALSIDASLWTRFGGGDEHILFRKEDFDAPRFSRLFRILQQTADDRIQRHLPLFRSYLGMPLSSIASPADVIGVPPAKKRETRPALLPSWSRNSQFELFSVKSKGDANVAVPEPAGSPEEKPQEGIKDTGSVPAPDEGTPAIVDFSRSFASERVLLGLYAAFIVAIAALAARGTVPSVEAFFIFLGGLGCIAVCLACSYATLDEVRAKIRVWFVLEWARIKCDAVQYAVRRLTDWKSRVELKELEKLRQLEASDSRHVKQEDDRVAEVKRALSSSIDELDLTRTALNQAEAEEAARLLRGLQSRHDVLLREGAFLAKVPVQGLRRRQLKELLAWRNRVEELARIGPPIIISAADQAGIRSRFDVERRALQNFESFVQAQAQGKIQRIREARERRRKRQEMKRESTLLRFEKRKKRLQQTIDDGMSWVLEHRRELARRLAEMDRYREIRFVRYLPRVLGFSLQALPDKSAKENALPG